MMRLPLLLLIVPLSAASPQRGISLEVPTKQAGLLPVPERPPALSSPASPFEPAPLPNRDLQGPARPRASTEPTLAPTLFTRRDGFRGDGYMRGSTAQSEQERRVKPGAGFNLRMPLTGN